MTKVILDVWGGDDFTDHVARFHRPRNIALKLASREIQAGYLVNMAQIDNSDDLKFDQNDFDRRHLH
jgi:hypothetical protein